MEANKKYTVDTKGSCFMCLQLSEDIQRQLGKGKTAATVSPVYSVGMLSNYLQLNLKKVFNMRTLPNSLTTGALEKPEILVCLCRSCAYHLDVFLQVHKELEKIEDKMTKAIRSIRNIMASAERDPKRSTKYKARLSTLDPLGVVQANIAENLRMEFIFKGSSVAANKEKASIPDLRLLQEKGEISITPVPLPRKVPGIPKLAPLSTSSFFRGPSKRLQASSAKLTQVSKRPNSARGVETIDKNVPVVVDLDGDSDGEMETAVEESESGIVIQSISGANGLIVTPTAPKSTPLPSSSISNSDMRNSDTDIIKQSALKEADSFLDSLGIGVTATNIVSSTSPVVPSGSSMRSGPGRIVRREGTFIILDNGRCRCEVCGKTLGNYTNTKEAHKMIHLNRKHIKCIHCPATFRHLSNLKNHIFGLHTAEMLASFRQEAVPHATFKIMVKTFFRKIVKCVTVQGNLEPTWACNFCDKTYKTRLQAEWHMIQLHFDDLGKELQRLQQQPGTFVGLQSELLSSNTSNRSDSLPPDNDEIQCLDVVPAKIPVPSLLEDSANGKIKCRVCGKICLGKINLKRHMNLFHGKSVTPIMGAIKTQNTVNWSPCPYCSRRFTASVKLKVHVLNSHPLQVFSKYLPKGTTKEVIDSELNSILNNYRDLKNNMFGCNYCPREFSARNLENSLIQNHVLLSHFDSLVAKLQVNIVTRKSSIPTTVVQQEPSVFNIGGSSSTTRMSIASTSQLMPGVVAKVEEDDDVVEILPD